eukprot:scaffold9820_cov59-Cylindrotheca_fusiformis.AAC.1
MVASTVDTIVCIFFSFGLPKLWLPCSKIDNSERLETTVVKGFHAFGPVKILGPDISINGSFPTENAVERWAGAFYWNCAPRCLGCGSFFLRERNLHLLGDGHVPIKGIEVYGNQVHFHSPKKLVTNNA